MSRAFFMKKALCEKSMKRRAIIKEETKKTQENEKNAGIYLDFANFTDIYNFIKIVNCTTIYNIYSSIICNRTRVVDCIGII